MDAREGAGCGSVGDVTGAWLASAPLSPSLWSLALRHPLGWTKGWTDAPQPV